MRFGVLGGHAGGERSSGGAHISGCWLLQNLGLSAELVLLVRAWKGPSRVRGFCSVRCWVLREHASVFLSEKTQGQLGLRTASREVGRR